MAKESTATTKMGKLDSHLSSLWVLAALFVAVFVTICIYVYAGKQSDLPAREFPDTTVKGNLTVDGGSFNSKIFKTNDPTLATDTAALTDDQILSGVINATPTAAATFTLRTGAQISAAILAAEGHTMVAGDSFDLVINNKSTTAGHIITVAVATGITNEGSLEVHPLISAEDTAGVGAFRFRCTAADTYTFIRIG